jgi:hypothetical protein
VVEEEGGHGAVLREERPRRRGRRHRGGYDRHGLGRGRGGGCGGRGGWKRRRRGREAERAAVAGGDAARGEGGGDADEVVGAREPLGRESAPRGHRAVTGHVGVHAAPVLPPPVPAAVPGQAHQGVPGAPLRPAVADLRGAAAGKVAGRGPDPGARGRRRGGGAGARQELRLRPQLRGQVRAGERGGPRPLRSHLSRARPQGGHERPGPRCQGHLQGQGLAARDLTVLF